MLSFYPGPSQVYPQIAQYLQDAYVSGMLSVNHRSAPAMELVAETCQLLREKLSVPQDYGIYFVSSATECWEIIAQSLIRKQSEHIYTGAFGEKWADYTQKLGVEVVRHSLNPEEEILLGSQCEMLCLTQNETSNGTQISMISLRAIRQSSSALLALDATSSMAGIDFDWSLGDVWFASVQKCFGLPAGMALLICSPQALEKARQVNERNHYNSLLFIHENAAKYQTHYTPNVLNIYLLNRVLKQVRPIVAVASTLAERAAELYQFFEERTSWKPLIQNPSVRSDTVLALTGTSGQIKGLKQAATQQKISIGNGYGAWKESTFRIANFPALTNQDFEELRRFIITYENQ
ncbi:MAG: aminotransferase class V-fold PLP-dependent enzyme [Siphonobacter sp.]